MAIDGLMVEVEAPRALACPLLPKALFAIPAHELDRLLSRDLAAGLPIQHDFAPGVYLRTMLIPAGTLLTARCYKTPHLCIMSAGEMTIWGTGFGRTVPFVAGAPYRHRGLSGEQRIGYAHVDTVWTTVLPNPDNETDPEAVLARYTEPVAAIDPLPLDVANARLAAIFAISGGTTFTLLPNSEEPIL